MFGIAYRSTVNLQVRARIIRNTSAVLQILGVSEKDNTDDTVPNRRGDPRDGTGSDGGTLTVASGNDPSGWALVGGAGEEVGHGVYGVLSGSTGEEVIGQ